MPVWIPEPVWQYREVFLIGGGASLIDFDWELLRDECTVGCNDAYTLGGDICKTLAIGDGKYFEHYKQDLENYTGTIFTNSPRLFRTRLPWLWTTRRQAWGLHKEVLGWNSNTGAMAINLALLLGARKVFLLGYDMKPDDKGRTHWCRPPLMKPNNNTYVDFSKGFVHIAKDLDRVFPGSQVFNITTDSTLETFPKIDFEIFWETRKRKKVKSAVA